jgi:hypothetical protein
LIARAEAHVLRLALIYAALESTKGKREISLAHLQAALAIWDYCEASARFIFGAALGDDTADEILRYLKTVGADGATRTDISKVFSRNKTSAEIGRALAVLQTHSLAKPVLEKTGGAPAERWVFVGALG